MAKNLALSWKLMRATEEACCSVAMGEEGAAYYNESFTLLNRCTSWIRGFVAGWGNDSGYCEYMPISIRIVRYIRSFL